MRPTRSGAVCQRFLANPPDGSFRAFLKQALRNFLIDVCGCAGTWEPSSFIDMAVTDIRNRAGNGRVLCALSGGVDSAVAATLVHQAIGDQVPVRFEEDRGRRALHG